MVDLKAGIFIYTTENSSLNGTASEATTYQSTGATDNGGAANEMSEPVPEQSYEDVVRSAEEAIVECGYSGLLRLQCLDSTY